MRIIDRVSQRVTQQDRALSHSASSVPCSASLERVQREFEANVGMTPRSRKDVEDAALEDGVAMSLQAEQTAGFHAVRDLFGNHTMTPDHIDAIAGTFLDGRLLQPKRGDVSLSLAGQAGPNAKRYRWRRK